jgi:tetratricopeptide (TPR) repeat protein
MNMKLTRGFLSNLTSIAIFLNIAVASYAQPISDQQWQALKKMRKALDIIAMQRGECVTITNDPDPPTNVRSKPIAESDNIVGQLKPYVFINVINNQNGWLEIDNPTKGWVFLEKTIAGCGSIDSSFFERLRELGERSLNGDSKALDILVRYSYQGADGVSADVLYSEYLPKLLQKQPDLLIANLNIQPESGRYHVLRYVFWEGGTPLGHQLIESVLSRYNDSPTAKTWQSIITSSKTESQQIPSSGTNVLETNSENPIDNKYFQQALKKSNKGDYNGAIADYDKVIALYPGFSGSYYNQGLDYFKLGNYEKAIGSLNKSLAISPDDSMALFYRGLVYSALKNYQEAINDFNKVIAISPEDADAHFNRGVARSKLGDVKGAINDYDYAIRFDSNFVDAYINRGVERADLGDNQEAIQDFDQAIRLNSDFANSYVYRGMARSKLGDKKGALSDLRYAAELCKVQGRSAQYQTVIELIQKLGG